MAAQRFVGSWMVRVTRGGGGGGLNLISFGGDGVIITAQEAPVVPDQPGAPFRLLHRSPGHGTWTSLDASTAELAFVYLVNGDQGRSFGTVTVNSTLKLSDDGQTLSGEVSGTATDPTGRETATGTNTVTGRRIVVNK